MRRREFITLLGGAVAWPLVARAQQPAMPVIGFLDGQSFDLHLMTAFRQALKDAGYTEGRNVAIYFRSANGQTDRLVTLAGDIVGRRVAVVVTAGGGASALAAYAATTTIPIVFVSGVDPVTSGLVMSLNRPGSNATGVYIFQQVLEGKRLAMLHGLVPAATLIAVLLNPTNANFQTQLRGVQDAARVLAQQVSILSASTERDIDIAFATVTASGAGALLVGSDPFFNSERDQVVDRIRQSPWSGRPSPSSFLRLRRQTQWLDGLRRMPHLEGDDARSCAIRDRVRTNGRQSGSRQRPDGVVCPIRPCLLPGLAGGGPA